MTVAITGATGHLGRLVVKQLAARSAAKDVVGIVRSPAKAADLGITVREGDYDRPETLERALAGIDTLLLVSASEIGKRIAQHRNAIAAAKKNGVRRIVYTSLLRADSSPIGLAEEHRTTEADIRASGIAFTFLRNGWYTENYTGSLATALQAGAILGAAGEAKFSFAAREDYAEAALVALDESHTGRTYELAGDQAYTLSDLAAEVSRQSGKSVVYKDMPEAEYAKTLAGFGLPEPLAREIASWDTCAARGALFDDGRQLSKLIGRPTTPLSKSVADALAAMK